MDHVASMYSSSDYVPAELSEVYFLNQPYTEASSGLNHSYPNDDGYMSTADFLLLTDEEMYYPHETPSFMYVSDNPSFPILDAKQISSASTVPGFSSEACNANLIFGNPAHEQDSYYPPLSPFSDLTSELGLVSATNPPTCVPQPIEPPSPELRYSVQAHPHRAAAPARKAQTK